MKFFLSKLILFLSVFVLLSVSLFAVTSWVTRKNTSFKIDESKDVLVLGDSHVETAINDSLITNVINVAQSADAFLYSFRKLELFLTQNSQIKTILLSLSFISLDKELDKWIKHPRYSWKMQIYMPFYNLSDYLNFLSNSEFYRLWLKMPFYNKNYFFREYVYSDLEFGGYNRLVRDKLNEDYSLRLGSKGQFSKIEKPSKYQVKYLHKIVDECKKRDIKLVLINTPIHENGLRYYDTSFYYNYYNQNLSEIELWDYSKLKVPDYCFGDIEHLNYKGAVVFSKLLDKRLKEEIAQ